MKKSANLLHACKAVYHLPIVALQMLFCLLNLEYYIKIEQQIVPLGKIKVFPVLHTIFFSTEGSKHGFFYQRVIKCILFPRERQTNPFLTPQQKKTVFDTEKTLILVEWLLPSLCLGIKLHTRKIIFFPQLHNILLFAPQGAIKCTL